MELKYTEKPVANQDRNSVNMLLYGSIGGDILARYFVDEMQWHHNQGKNITVKINSVGGSVFEGYGIMDAIEEYGADTYIVGLAASMAGVIAQVGKRRKANHRATMMAHAPSNGSKDLIEIVKKTLTKELTSRSSLSEDEITEIMNGKNDKWFDAETMYANGLIDELITSGDKLVNSGSKDAEELYSAYNSLLNNKSKPIQMENLMNHLGLENKTEADVLNIVKDLEVQAAKVEPLMTENTALKAENETLKNTAQEHLDAKVDSLVQNAIDAGKIKEDAKEHWIGLAVENFGLVEKAFESIQVVKKADNLIVNNVAKPTEGKTYEWYAENEPQTLVNMMKNNPEKFEELSKEMYNNKRK